MNEPWKLLVVEDNPDDLVSLRLLLRADTTRSYHIVGVETGAAALCACREATAPFDTILLDYHLPDFDAEEWLEAWGGPAGLPSPVVVLTGADASTIDARALLRAGAEDFIGKSWINTESLVRVLDNAAERFVMARQVRESADRYRWLFENMPSGYAHWQRVATAEPADFECLVMNTQLESVTGWWEPVGRRLRAILSDPASGDPDLFQLVERVTVTGQSERGEFQLNPGGRWISVTAYRPAPGECVTVIDDITVRKRELQASEERFRFATESSQIGVWDWNLQTGMLRHSGLVADEPGVAPDSIQGREHQWQDLLHRDDPGRIAGVINGKQDESGNFELEMRLRVEPEGYRWVLTRGRVWERGPSGEPLRIFGTCTDIDARKRAEALNNRLAAIIEASSDLIATATPEGEVDYMNRAGRAMLGIGADASLRGSLIPEYHPAWAYRLVQEEGIPVALARGEWLGDNAMRWRDGPEVPVSQLILGHRDPVTGKVDFISTICRDLSPRLEMEQALRQLQQEQELILDSAPALIWYKDTENRILRVNVTAAETIGLPKDRIEGHSMADFYPPEDADRHYQDDLAVIRSGKARLGIVEAYRFPSGERRWLQTDKVPLTDDDGQVTRILVMAVDITARKQAEETLEQMRYQFAEGQRIAHLGTWEYLAATQTTLWSDEQKRIYGLDPAQPSPDYAAMLCHHIHPDDAPELDRCFRTVLEHGAPFQNENRIVRPDGTVRWICNQAQPYFDEAGQVVRYIGATLDITERRQAEEALRASEERFRALTQAIPGITWETDAFGANTFVTDAWQSYTGLSAAEKAGSGWVEVVHPEDRESLSSRWAESVSSRRPFEARYRMRAADGSYRWFMARAVPCFEANGQVVRWVGSSTEIEELIQAQSTLQEADRRKDEFLATLAHELRNPLAPIRNVVQGLQQLQASGQFHHERTPALLAMVERQVDHLVKLVDDLLDISRITRGKIVLEKEPVDLCGAIQQALEATHPAIEAGRHRLQVRLPPEPLRVDGDPVRLVQVFANLLNNAAKFTEPEGGIQVQARATGGQALVSIKDEGLGISTEMLPHIFDLFTQGDAGSGRSQSGLGIGLALARNLAELHGGRIEARSEGPGQGSEFRVYLPLATDASPSVRPEGVPPQPLHGCRIMIVDDNHDAADSLASSLEFKGAEVQVFYEGVSALDRLADFRPQLILLDLGMPVIDGYETARRVRSHPDGAKVLLVALSGWGREEDRRQTRDAGFDHHLVKPADLDSIIGLLASVSRTSATR